MRSWLLGSSLRKMTGKTAAATARFTAGLRWAMRDEQTDRAGHDTGPDAALAEPAARGDGNAVGAPPPGREPLDY